MDQKLENGPCAAHIGHRKSKSIWVCGGDDVNCVKDRVGPSHGEVSQALGGPLDRGYGGQTRVDIS
jgi:hypothetical protein